jgi:hypothetical protein
MCVCVCVCVMYVLVSLPDLGVVKGFLNLKERSWYWYGWRLFDNSQIGLFIWPTEPPMIPPNFGCELAGVCGCIYPEKVFTCPWLCLVTSIASQL